MCHKNNLKNTWAFLLSRTIYPFNCGKHVVEIFNFVFVSKINFPFQKVVFTRPDRTLGVVGFQIETFYLFIVGILINLKICHLQTENLKKLIFVNKN
jgi:hypothetical protein